MGIASLVLGIISLLMGWIPFICFIMFALAVVGIILGSIDACRKSKIEGGKKGFGIAGLVVSALSIPVIIISSAISIIAFIYVVNENLSNDYNNLQNDYYDEYRDYWQEYNLDYDNFMKNYL